MSTDNRPPESRGYRPIEDYGMIGNLRTVALVAKADASVDFMCYPNFDSPTVFGRLLAAERGGFFQISPSESCLPFTSKQIYLPSSNVLLTRFNLARGIAQVTDLLPVTFPQEDGLLEGPCAPPSGPTKRLSHSWPWLIRKVDVVRGEVEFVVKCQPCFDYGRQSHTVELVESENGSQIVAFESSHMSMDLRYETEDHPPESQTTDEHSSNRVPNINWFIIDHAYPMPDGSTMEHPEVSARFSLVENQTLIFVLREIPTDHYHARDARESDAQPCSAEFLDPPMNMAFLKKIIGDTIHYWHVWAGRCTYRGRWREMVVRSALALKLLTYEPTGAIIAAPTLSLPEELGGNKNWDYRFTWIRDAAFTVYAFLRIGFTDEAAGFMRWIEQRCKDLKDCDDSLRIMYDIHGGHGGGVASGTIPGRPRGTALIETTLPHWEGYEGSGPVRIGNGAATQVQLDIYGELMDAIYLCDKYVEQISYDFWVVVRDRIVNHIVAHWRETDHGIWEIRGKQQQYTYSKVMCWVTLDRGIRLAAKHSLPADSVTWLHVRNEIYEDIMRHSWSEKHEHFVQFYGSDNLDAANLIMSLVFFIAPNDPRFLKTLDRTLKTPAQGGLTVNNLVFRYNIKTMLSTELKGQEGTFSICTFWLAEALARAGQHTPRYLNRALLMFEDILGYANHLGLFSEEINLSGRAMGNFPQAFTHLSLISAAFNLDRALENTHV